MERRGTTEESEKTRNSTAMTRNRRYFDVFPTISHDSEQKKRGNGTHYGVPSSKNYDTHRFKFPNTCPTLWLKLMPHPGSSRKSGSVNLTCEKPFSACAGCR